MRDYPPALPQEALEVALLGFDGRPGLAGDLGEEVDTRQRRQALPLPVQERRDVMLQIICRDEGLFWHRRAPPAPQIYTITALMI